MFIVVLFGRRRIFRFKSSDEENGEYVFSKEYRIIRIFGSSDEVPGC